MAFAIACMLACHVRKGWVRSEQIMHPAFAEASRVVPTARYCADALAVAPVVADDCADALRGTCGVDMAGPDAEDERKKMG